MSGVSYTSASVLGTFLECLMYGIFISFFFAACYVQREKYSKGQGLNRVLAFATVYFGLAVTVVSEK